jgi:succinate-acetate transporter protein
VKLIGFVLIAFGIFALVMGGISYTDRDKVLDIGPVEVQSEQRETIPLSPIVGIAALAGGVALVIAGAKTRSRV